MATDSFLYAFRGNKSNEFYKYFPNGDSWSKMESIPFTYKPGTERINPKRVGKGASLCWDGENMIYATKGNSTYELWAYDILTNQWTFKDYIPSSKLPKAGTSIVFLNGKVYVLVAGITGEFVYNFYSYDTLQKAWSELWSAPQPDGKPYKAGSGLALLNDTIYCLKGSGNHNYFYAYPISENYWIERETFPLIHPELNKRKKVKDGGAITSDRNRIYAIKGGGSNEFWQYCPEQASKTAKVIVNETKQATINAQMDVRNLSW